MSGLLLHPALVTAPDHASGYSRLHYTRAHSQIWLRVPGDGRLVWINRLTGIEDWSHRIIDVILTRLVFCTEATHGVRDGNGFELYSSQHRQPLAAFEFNRDELGHVTGCALFQWSTRTGRYSGARP